MLLSKIADKERLMLLAKIQKEFTNMNRRLERLRAVQALFQVDVTKVDWHEAINNTLDEGEHLTPFLEKIVSGTIAHQQEIDTLISDSLENWKLERVGNVDRAILRLAVHELQYIDDIPANVTFNEAIELAKAFGGEESGKFLNGVLSNIVKKLNK